MTWPSRWTFLLVAAGALAAIWPGIANGAATRAEYVAQAEPHCASANRDIHELNKASVRQEIKGNHRAAGRLGSKTGTRLSRSVRQVRAIAAPPGDEQTIMAWLDLVQQVADNNVRMGRAHARGNIKLELRIQKRNEAIRDRAHRVVAGFGFHACVGEGSIDP